MQYYNTAMKTERLPGSFKMDYISMSEGSYEQIIRISKNIVKFEICDIAVS